MDQPDDVLEHGPTRTPRRSVPIVVAAVVVLGLIAYGAVRLGGEGPRAGAAGSASPAPVASHTPSASASWPVAEGLCQSEARLPIVRPTPAPLRQTTGLRVVVGGAGLSVVDVDTGHSRTLSGVPNGENVTELVRSGDDVYALSSPCYQHGDDEWSPTVLRITGDGAIDRVHFAGPVGSLVGGSAGVWGLHYPDGDGKPTLLRSLAGESVRLPKRVWLAGVAEDAIVAEVMGDPESDDRPALAVFDPDTGKVRRRIPGASPLGVGDDFVLWMQDCASPYSVASRRCVLHRAALGRRTGSDRTYKLPPGRVPFGLATLSRDGRYAAFQLSMPHQDSQYTTGHPGPPSEIAVLDLASGALHLIPGLELAPKSFAGLAFAPDARWLLLAINAGSHGRLLAWHVGSDRLLRCPGTLPGPLSTAPPMVVMAG
ncbi:MAG: hypothetical protein ACRDMV_01700 [Streptosporangiales bacterium]